MQQIAPGALGLSAQAESNPTIVVSFASRFAPRKLLGRRNLTLKAVPVETFDQLWKADRPPRNGPPHLVKLP